MRREKDSKSNKRKTRVEERQSEIIKRKQRTGGK